MTFENISILKGDLSKEQIDEEIKKFKAFFEENNIKTKVFENIGLRNLAYEIKNNTKGNYLRYEFSTDKNKIPDFEKFLRENDNVIKFMTISQEKEINTNDRNDNEEKLLQMLTKLLEITNSYVDDYCETHDEYVLSDEEINDIEDEEERDRAIDLKETDDFLEEVATYIEECSKDIKKENLEEEEENYD